MKPATEISITTIPITRFKIQMPRKLKRVRTLLTKYVIPNHQRRAPQYNSQIPHQLKAYGTARHHKRKTGKQTYKQEYNEGVGESHKKSSNKIMKITARGRRYRTDRLDRITTESINTEKEQHDTADNL